MYTGITKGLYPIVNINKSPGLTSYTVDLSVALCNQLQPGDSVAIDGVCQTVVTICNTQVSFQAIQETLDKTTLNDLILGSLVSIERSLRVGDEIGGHEVSGHVFGTAVIHEKIIQENNLTLGILCNPDWMKYILPKGFIAVDGSSLTVGETYPEKGIFYLHLIPETLRLTNFARKEINDRVNIEFDHKTKTIVDSIERILSTRQFLSQNLMNTVPKDKKYITPEQSELGQTSDYDPHYNPDRLFPIPRAPKREEIGVDPYQLPFYGFDSWNHYEVSWLNAKGKPVVAIAEIVYDCETPYLIESKSLKLYFNSFNNTQFENAKAVQSTIERDLAACLGGRVYVNVSTLKDSKLVLMQAALQGECIDDLDVTCSVYQVEPQYLMVGNTSVTEVLYSDLLKSNCLVTKQPDWGSVQIAYTGKQIDREGLLKYLVSFRNHNEFHEQCIERIFVDIMQQCNPEKLTVYGRYTRRGGLDINPWRSTERMPFQGKNQRLIRQ